MPEATPHAAPRQRILVVDDDPETARMLGSWFEGQPYEILHAPDGVAGLPPTH